METSSFHKKQSKSMNDVILSVLDLVPITEGATARDAFHHSVALAQHVEKLGFYRYWFAEHHSMPAIASSATSLVIGHIANATSTIRVGSGGIMLPNHAPLVIAEQFGTLESLYPGRIDLGIGRAPGSDQATMRALRRDGRGVEDFPASIQELQSYFNGTASPVRAIPGENVDIPMWLLGSSGYSAQLAAKLGLPFAFASHFSPDYTVQAMEIYHNQFQPSADLDAPYSMICLNVIVADTDEEANYLATTQQQAFLNLVRGTRLSAIQPPVENMDALWSAHEKQIVEHQLRLAVNGSPKTVKEKLQHILNETKANEIMVNTQVFDHTARMRSYELLSTVVGELLEK